MVSKVVAVVEESMKAKQQQQQAQQKGKDHHQQQQQQPPLQKKQIQIQCNKGKACKFKRSSFSGEDDGASSAILLLACIACTPSSI
uniref:Uncharacterized protein n=1 Tax=Nelumbo nucifera TaxID=4432 RepID=A0A822YU89_NELNU|nr:TPA_asm: hypothetical protein HUJ06_004966 [Nelumbo nucifera]